jgi:FecR protein
MRNDYLWDGSGEPDPEVQRLERLLSEFRSHRPAPRSQSRLRWSAVAAAAALVVTGAWLVSGGAPEGWQVARANEKPGRLTVGETLETGAGGHATVNVGDIGIVEVEANSRLRLERAGRKQQRMSLDHGLIHAFIWAPPRTFVVDTPSAVATDLGCFYTLGVDKDGSGLVSVQAGWVSFERNGRESFIPAGAACCTRPGIGPGTPYREQASPVLQRALQDFDFARGGDPALAIVLAQATKDDAFTLWHLLARCDPAQRPRVYNALAALIPPPAGVTREGVTRGDGKMLDQWWNQLGLGDTGWWRHLERRW